MSEGESPKTQDCKSMEARIEEEIGQTSGGIPPDVEPADRIAAIIARTIERSHILAQIMPMMSVAELMTMAEDIKANGLMNPIVKLGDKNLDGRNREVACIIAGVEPKYVQFTALNITTPPIEWIVSQNVLRRHLTVGQRAMIGVKLIPELEKEARARQGVRTDLHPDQDVECGRSAEKAAKTVGVSPDSIKSALKIQHLGIPEVQAAAMSGKLTLNAAIRIAVLPPDEQHRLLTVEVKTMLALIRNERNLPHDLENVIADYPELKSELLNEFKNNPKIGKAELEKRANELVANKQKDLLESKNKNGKPGSRMPEKDDNYDNAAGTVEVALKDTSREVVAEHEKQHLMILIPFKLSIEHVMNAIRDLDPEMKKCVDEDLAVNDRLTIEVVMKKEEKN